MTTTSNFLPHSHNYDDDDGRSEDNDAENGDDSV